MEVVLFVLLMVYVFGGGLLVAVAVAFASRIMDKKLVSLRDSHRREVERLEKLIAEAKRGAAAPSPVEEAPKEEPPAFQEPAPLPSQAPVPQENPEPPGLPIPQAPPTPAGTPLSAGSPQPSVSWMGPPAPEPPPVPSTPIPLGFSESPPAAERSPKAAPSRRRTPPPAKPARGWSDWEEILGSSWLNKLGVGILVIGISLLMGFAFPSLSPVGKIVVGALVSLALLSFGHYLENRPEYRVYGRGLLGGGAALLYFTTWAVHFAESTRLIESPTVGLVLLSAVAAGIIASSLRYRSQVVTGIAYVLGFITVLLSDISFYNQTATCLLAVSLVILCLRLRWYPMMLGGLIATYGCYFFAWNDAVLRGHAAGGTAWNAVLLVSYWILFTLPTYWGGRKSRVEGLAPQVLNLANAAGLLILIKLQFPSGRWTFPFLLGLGIAYAALAALSRRRNDRPSYLFFGTLAAGLLIAAFPNQFANASLASFWAVEALALLVLGFRLKELHFRIVGWFAFALLAGYLLLAPPMGAAFSWRGFTMQAQAVGLLLTSAALYFTRLRLHERFSALASDGEELVVRIASHVAAGLMLIALWRQFDAGLVAILWCGLGLLLVEHGVRQRIHDLCLQGYAAAGSAAVWGALHNYGLQDHFWFAGRRFWSVTALAALLFALCRRLLVHERQDLAGPFSSTARRVALHVGGALLAALVWFEATPLAVGLIWGAAAVILIECGALFKSLDLRLQGYAAGALAFSRLVLTHLTTEQMWTDAISFRLLTVSLMAAQFYCLYRQAARIRREGNLRAFERRVPELFSWLAAVSVAALMRFEAGMAYVAVGWGILTVAYLLVGTIARHPHWRQVGYGLTAATLVRTFTTNLTLPEMSIGYGSRLSTTVGVIALLFAAYALLQAFRLRSGETLGRGGFFAWFERRATDVTLFSAMGLMVLLTALEAPHEILTVGWAIQALLFFTAGLFIKESRMRLAGVGLLLFCILKVFLYDLRGLETVPRIFSFIGLGLILLLVSFLYTRFSAVIKRYL